jgi:hypothetical protein
LSGVLATVEWGEPYLAEIDRATAQGYRREAAERGLRAPAPRPVGRETDDVIAQRVWRVRRGPRVAVEVWGLPLRATQRAMLLALVTWGDEFAALLSSHAELEYRRLVTRHGLDAPGRRPAGGQCSEEEQLLRARQVAYRERWGQSDVG